MEPPLPPALAVSESPPQSPLEQPVIVVVVVSGVASVTVMVGVGELAVEVPRSTQVTGDGNDP